MRETASAGGASLDKLDAVFSLAAECLRDMHREYIARFEDLRLQLDELKKLVQEYLPLAREMEERAPASPPEAGRDSVENVTGELVKPEVALPPLASGEEAADKDEADVAVSQKSNSDELKKRILDAFPACKELENAAQASKRLVDMGELPGQLRNALDTIINYYKKLGDLKSFVEPQEHAAGRQKIGEQARLLINQIKVLDEQDHSGERAAKVQDVRKKLWEFIQEATNNEYHEINPPTNEHLTSWLHRNGLAAQGSDLIESERVSSHFAKDYVVKTVRRGIIRVASGYKQVLQKAKVQVSNGNHQVQLG